mgnify:CR=1 FL=1
MTWETPSGDGAIASFDGAKAEYYTELAVEYPGGRYWDGKYTIAGSPRALPSHYTPFIRAFVTDVQ